MPAYKETMQIGKFLCYLQHEKRYSPHTVQAYATDLQQFAQFVLPDFGENLNQIGHKAIRSFIMHLMETGVSASAVNRKISTLRSFYKYALQSGEVRHNPMLLVRAPKMPKKLPVLVETHKLNSLLDASETFSSDFASQRDRVVLELLFGTGIRLAELLQLKDTDISLYGSSIKVLGKRHKERIVPLHKPLLRLLQDYIQLKEKQDFNEKSRTLILTNKGTPAYPALIYRTVRHYLSQISTQSKKSPHVLRHSFATALLDGGADLNAIKELLGHAGLAATQVYTHSSVERIKSIYKQAHPKA